MNTLSLSFSWRLQVRDPALQKKLFAVGTRLVANLTSDIQTNRDIDLPPPLHHQHKHTTHKCQDRRHKRAFFPLAEAPAYSYSLNEGDKGITFIAIFYQKRINKI